MVRLRKSDIVRLCRIPRVALRFYDDCLRLVRRTDPGGALPEGLPAKAQAKHAEMQAKLDLLFDSVRPVVAETQGEMKGTLAQKIGKLSALQEVETRRPTRPPRFADRPLPLRRVEKKVRSEEFSADGAKPSHQVPAKATPSPPPVEVVNKDGIAPELIELAESLGNSPARILSYVHDNIDFDPKWGAAKPPLGTLWEKSGTSWEQAWLLRDLLTAAGVDARFEWGEIEVPTELITNLTGLDDPWRAGDLLTTAGVPIVLLTQGGEVIGARMSHVWVKGWVDYIPKRGATPGPGDYWIKMAPPFVELGLVDALAPQKTTELLVGQRRCRQHDLELLLRAPVLRTLRSVVALGFLVHGPHFTRLAQPTRERRLAHTCLFGQSIRAAPPRPGHLPHHLGFEGFGIRHASSPISSRPDVVCA